MSRYERTWANGDRARAGGGSVRTAVRRVAWDSLTLGAVCLLASSTISAQTMDEFRTAAAADGVEVIPFPDLYSKAKALAEEVERRKYEATKFNISVLGPQKTNLLTAVKNTRKAIEEKEKEISAFKTAHPDGSAAPLEEDLGELRKALTEQQEEVEEMNEDNLEPGIEAWRRLWNARGGLREIFEDVVEEVADAKSSPTTYLKGNPNPSPETIDSLKRYLDVIENEIEVQAKTHLDQELGAKGTDEEFSKLLAKNEV
jgi:hypothetical protein